MRKNKEPLLSAEDIVRIKLKYPSRVKQSVKEPTKEPTKGTKNPKELRQRKSFSKDYISLRYAVQDPRLPLNRPLDSCSIVSIGPGHVKRGEWVLMAWWERYKKSKSAIFWNGGRHNVRSYISQKDIRESNKMMGWWDELLAIVPKDFPAARIPTDEEVAQFWKELENKKGNQ